MPVTELKNWKRHQNWPCFQYDGLNQRTVKETYSGGAVAETGHFYDNDRWQCLEERARVGEYIKAVPPRVRPLGTDAWVRPSDGDLASRFAAQAIHARKRIISVPFCSSVARTRR